MKHQLLVVFAASLSARDGEGIRLCCGLKEVPERNVPPRGNRLVIAGFAFKQFRDPIVARDTTTHIIEPGRPVRFESFKLRLDDGPFGDFRQAKQRRGVDSATGPTVGLIVSDKTHDVTKLIKTLEKKGYHVVIGNARDGGFNSYPAR